MKVAVVLDIFPKLSESFIINQIVSLIDQKIDVHIFARKSSKGEPVNELFERYNLARMTTYEPSQSDRSVIRKAKHLSLLFLLFFKAPVTFFKLVYFERVLFNRIYLYAVWPLLNNKENFDLVHTHFGPAGVKVCNLQRLGYFKVPVLCSFHGYDVDRNDFRSNPSYYRYLFGTAEIITGNSGFTVTNIARLGCPAEKLRVLPESLFTDYFKAERRPPADSHLVRILTVARLVEFKGIEYSLRAVAELVKRGNNNFTYTVIGDGPLKDSLAALATDLGVTKYVRFLGARTQDFIIQSMQDSDIFLLSGVKASDGREENQGLVLQEAQAMELPVIASDTGGIKEGVINDRTGFLVMQRDVRGFADRLELLMTDMHLRRQLGREGRKFVRENFDSTALGKKLIAMYREILG